MSIRYRTIAIAAVVATGCASASDVRVQVTPLASESRAIDRADCSIAMLRSDPKARFTKIAIVEGWGDPSHPDALLDSLRRSACAAGADALLIIEATSQVTQPHLYEATPNEASEETSGHGSHNPGSYIMNKEHIAKIGEAGHSGYYVDAVAIVYDR